MEVIFRFSAKTFVQMSNKKSITLPDFSQFSDGLKPIGKVVPDSFWPSPEDFYKCIDHIYKKTEPSQLDEHGVLIWKCVFCDHKVSST